MSFPIFSSLTPALRDFSQDDSHLPVCMSYHVQLKQAPHLKTDTEKCGAGLEELHRVRSKDCGCLNRVC